MANKTEDNDILTGTLREFITRVSTRFLCSSTIRKYTKYHWLLVGAQVTSSAGNWTAAIPGSPGIHPQSMNTIIQQTLPKALQANYVVCGMNKAVESNPVNIVKHKHYVISSCIIIYITIIIIIMEVGQQVCI